MTIAECALAVPSTARRSVGGPAGRRAEAEVVGTAVKHEAGVEAIAQSPLRRPRPSEVLRPCRLGRFDLDPDYPSRVVLQDPVDSV